MMKEKIILMDEFLMYVKGLNYIVKLKKIFALNSKEKIKIIDRIIEEEKCFFVMSNISEMLFDISIDEKGKNRVFIGLCIQKMLFLLRQNLSLEMMEQLDDFLKSDGLNEKLDSLVNEDGFGKEKLQIIIRRLNFFQRRIKESIGILREKI